MQFEITLGALRGVGTATFWLVFQTALLATGLLAQPTDQAKSIDFGLQIRPILSEHCFHCHGPDEAHRQADLRLDQEDSAKLPREGKQPIHPGSIERSQIIHRIESEDPDLVMPPPSARKTVTPEQRELLKRWIEQGAPWGSHWAFAAPQRWPIPLLQKIDSKQDSWAQSPIDAWVLETMRQKGLSPADPADPYTLVRRLWLDIVGLHPEPVRVERFVAEYRKDPKQAVESMVGELLDHPGFGEHWARLWLDLARYADTKGYEKDLKRDLWPYRDWVIQSLNADMPFDQFTIEQLAGDLLENPSTSQRIATAFHRATLSNDEGGTDDEEYRIAAVKDRVDTTLQVWMVPVAQVRSDFDRGLLQILRDLQSDRRCRSLRRRTSFVGSNLCSADADGFNAKPKAANRRRVGKTASRGASPGRSKMACTKTLIGQCPEPSALDHRSRSNDSGRGRATCDR
jgi:hypothetical protein